MSISGISAATTNPAISQAKTAQVKSKSDATTASQPQQPVAKDTVTISSAATQVSQASQAAQEAAETPQQTAKEAQHGDLQAKKLLAKQAAAEEAKEPATVKSQEAAGTNE